MCLLSSFSSLSILSFDIPTEAVRGSVDPVLGKAWRVKQENDVVLWISA